MGVWVDNPFTPPSVFDLTITKFSCFMEQNKDLSSVNALENSVVKAFLAQYKSVRNEDFNTSKMVGNNGFVPGQQFVLTGEVVVQNVTDNQGQVTGCYLGLPTTEGTVLSLQSVMGISSLKGYSIKESVNHEYLAAKDSPEPTVEVVTPEVVEDFDFDNVFKPITRELLKFAAYAAESGCFKDKRATYLGTVCKQVTQKQGTDRKTGKKTDLWEDPINPGRWCKTGLKRVISTKLWAID